MRTLKHTVSCIRWGGLHADSTVGGSCCSGQWSNWISCEQLKVMGLWVRSLSRPAYMYTLKVVWVVWLQERFILYYSYKRSHTDGAIKESRFKWCGELKAAWHQWSRWGVRERTSCLSIWWDQKKKSQLLLNQMWKITNDFKNICDILLFLMW